MKCMSNCRYRIPSIIRPHLHNTVLVVCRWIGQCHILLDLLGNASSDARVGDKIISHSTQTLL